MIAIKGYGLNTSRIIAGEKKQVLQPILRGDFISYPPFYLGNEIREVYTESNGLKWRVGNTYPVFVVGTELQFWYCRNDNGLYFAHLNSVDIGNAWVSGNDSYLEKRGYKPFMVTLAAIKKAKCNYWLLRW